MKSKKCLFSNAIFKSDLKRFLPFTIPLLIAELIIFPVVIYGSGFNLPNNPLTTADFYGISIASDVASLIFACVFSMLVFSYLFKSNRCNAIHAFPIGRRGLFISSALAGYILLVVPQIIGFCLSIPGIHMCSKDTFSIVLIQFVSIFACSFIFYCTGLLSAMLAGNIFAGSMIYLLINFGSFVFRSVSDIVISHIGRGLSHSEILDFGLSPFVKITGIKLSLSYQYTYEFTKSNYRFIVKSLYANIAVLALVTVIFAVLAYILYKVRKLEVAGDMVAFKCEIPVISVIASFFGGALMSLFISIFINLGTIAFFCSFAIFSFVAFIVTQMVLHKSARIFKPLTLLIWLISCAVSIAGLFLFATYRTNYIPDIKDVKEASVDASYSIEVSDKDGIEDVEAFHKLLLENEKKKGKESSDDMGWIEDSAYFETGDFMVTIQYVLSNGRTVTRIYSFSDKDKALIDSLDNFESEYHTKGILAQLEDIDFEITDLSVRCYKDGEESFAFTNVKKENYADIYKSIKDYSIRSIADYRTSNKKDTVDGYKGSSDSLVDFDDLSNAYNTYDLILRCRISKESMEKLADRFDDFESDPSGVYLNMDYDYHSERRDNYNYPTGFFIEIDNMGSDNELIKLLSTYDNPEE